MTVGELRDFLKDIPANGEVKLWKQCEESGWHPIPFTPTHIDIDLTAAEPVLYLG